MSAALFRLPRLESAVQAAAVASSARDVDELDILDALAGQADSVAGRALVATGSHEEILRSKASAPVGGRRSGEEVLQAAEEYATADGSMFLGTEHVLCVLLSPGSASWSLLASVGIEPRLVRSQVATEASEAGRPTETAEIRDRSSGVAVPWRQVGDLASDSPELSTAARVAQTLRNAEAALGVAVVTVANGSVDVSVRGFADAVRQTALSEDSRLRIGSLTKVLTAIAALALAERTVVSLDVPVGELLRSLRVDPAPGPTLRQLLTHTGGAPSGAWLHLPDDVAPTFVDAVDGYVELVSPPGERWEYSNVGYAVIGQALEDAAGLPLDTIIRESVLAPLGMLSTTIAATPTAELPEGYWIDRGDLVATPKRDIIMRAAGGAVSTPSDIARLLTFLAVPSASSAPPISEEGVRAMLEPQFAQAGPAAANHGIALRLRASSDGRRVGWHPGRISGFPSAMYLTDGAASAAMANTETLSAAPVAAAALAELIGSEVGA